MLCSVAQEHVKQTVNTILGGQATTTLQKAALDARLGRKNVSLRRERFNGRKAFKLRQCWKEGRFKGLLNKTIRASQANVTFLVDWKNVSWADDLLSTRSCICLILR